MRTTLILIIFLFLNFQYAFSQKSEDFEGVIHYKIDYQTPDGQIIQDKSFKYFGDSVAIYIKKGNYKQVYPSSSKLNNIVYLYKKNDYFYTLNNYDTILVDDYSTPANPILDYGTIDTSATVLGVHCRGYFVKTTNAINILFYAPSLYKKPEYFTNHLEFGYNHYTEDTRSIYLKLISYDGKMVTSFTAYKIEKKKIPDSVFRIPKMKTRRI